MNEEREGAVAAAIGAICGIALGVLLLATGAHFALAMLSGGSMAVVMTFIILEGE